MIAKNATESLEIFGHVSLMTLDSLMKCAFSCQTNGQTHGLIFSKLDKQMSTLFFLVLSISIWVKAFLSLALSISELGCYIKAISELTFRVYQRIRNPWFRSDLIYQHSSAGRHFKEACRMAHQHTGIAPLFLSSPFSFHYNGRNKWNYFTFQINPCVNLCIKNKSQRVTLGCEG